jgi:hypothetical protein
MLEFISKTGCILEDLECRYNLVKRKKTEEKTSKHDSTDRLTDTRIRK